MKQQAIPQTVRRLASHLTALAHDLHDHPETAFQEFHSSERMAEALRAQGHHAIVGVSDLATAVHATAGSGSLHVVVCAEYDALPQIGHACGHNVIAAAAVGAFCALAEIADAINLTVTLLGTPAEEGGGGKVLMLQRGAFDGAHAALMVHPSPIERDAMVTLAVSQLLVEFTGRAAHAAAAPERGLNAASALALAQAGIGMAREHFVADDRVHGIVIDGGAAPNIVPERAIGRFFVRAASVDRLAEVERRIVDVFRGAALMTGCAVSVRKTSPSYSDLRTHSGMASAWRQNARDLGRSSLCRQPGDGAASTDMGNISHAVPTIHPLIAIESNGANIHEAEFAAHTNGPSADRAAVDGAILLAQTVVDMAMPGPLRDELLSQPPFTAERHLDAPYLGMSWEGVSSFDPTTLHDR